MQNPLHQQAFLLLLQHRYLWGLSMAQITVPKPSVGFQPTQAIRQDRSTASDFGGDSFGQVAQLASAVAQRETEKMNVAAVQQATSSLYQYQNQALYGENGLYSKKGENAMGAADEIDTGFNSIVEQQLTSLKTPQQKAMFQTRVESMRQSLNSKSLSYQGEQIKVYQANQNAAIMESARNAAALSYSDPAEVARQIEIQDQTIFINGELNGLPAEQVNLQLNEAHSKTHAAVISQMVDAGDYNGAQAYFNSNEAQLMAVEKKTVTDQLKVAGQRKESQFKTDEIYANDIPEAEALKQARAISDPEVRDLVVNRLKTRYAEADQIAKAIDTQNYKTAGDVVESGKSTDSIDSKLWMALTPAQRSSLETRSRQVQSGQEPVTDWKVYTELSTMTPEQLLGVDIYSYRDRLDDAKYSQLVNEKQNLLQAKKSGENLHSATLTFNQRVKIMSEQAGIIPADKASSKWDEEEAKRYAAFQLEAANQVAIQEQRSGKKATGQEIQNILDEMVLNTVRISEWGSDPERLTYEVTDDERGNAYVPYEKIPQNNLGDMRNYLISNGKVASKDKIQRMYAAFLLKDKALIDQIVSE
jgi:hypothetical protein